MPDIFSERKMASTRLRSRRMVLHRASNVVVVLFLCRQAFRIPDYISSDCQVLSFLPRSSPHARTQRRGRVPRSMAPSILSGAARFHWPGIKRNQLRQRPRETGDGYEVFALSEHLDRDLRLRTM